MYGPFGGQIRVGIFSKIDHNRIGNLLRLPKCIDFSEVKIRMGIFLEDRPQKNLESFEIGPFGGQLGWESFSKIEHKGIGNRTRYSPGWWDLFSEVKSGRQYLHIDHRSDSRG